MVKFAGKDTPPVPSDRIYISGLPPTIGRHNIAKAFEAIGMVIKSSKLMEYGTASSAIIQLEDVGEAESAISTLNGLDPIIAFPGLPDAAAVEEGPGVADGAVAAPKQLVKCTYQGVGATPEPSDQIYLSGVPPAAAENVLSLIGVTAQWSEEMRDGTVASVKLGSLQDAAKAVNKLNKMDLSALVASIMGRRDGDVRKQSGSKVTRVKYKGHGTCPSASNSLYVRGLPEEVSTASFDAVFSQIKVRVRWSKMLPAYQDGSRSAIMEVGSMEEAVTAILCYDGTGALLAALAPGRGQNKGGEEGGEGGEGGGEQWVAERWDQQPMQGQDELNAAVVKSGVQVQQFEDTPGIVRVRFKAVGASQPASDHIVISGLPAKFEAKTLADVLPIGVTIHLSDVMKSAKGDSVAAVVQVGTVDEARRCIEFLDGKELVKILPPWLLPEEEEEPVDEFEDEVEKVEGSFQDQGFKTENTRAVRVKFRGGSPSAEIHMVGLPATGLEDEMIMDMFESITVHVVTKTIIADGNGTGSVAFVQLGSVEEANLAIEMFNGWEWEAPQF